jgi:hypothetical protein
MKNNDRETFDRRIERMSDHWFFKTSEGLMGPYDSRETASTELNIFVARCNAVRRMPAVSAESIC